LVIKQNQMKKPQKLSILSIGFYRLVIKLNFVFSIL
jgi:hypothetical protein